MAPPPSATCKSAVPSSTATGCDRQLPEPQQRGQGVWRPLLVSRRSFPYNKDRLNATFDAGGSAFNRARSPCKLEVEEWSIHPSTDRRGLSFTTRALCTQSWVHYNFDVRFIYCYYASTESNAQAPPRRAHHIRRTTESAFQRKFPPPQPPHTRTHTVICCPLIVTPLSRETKGEGESPLYMAAQRWHQGALAGTPRCAWLALDWSVRSGGRQLIQSPWCPRAERNSTPTLLSTYPRWM